MSLLQRLPRPPTEADFSSRLRSAAVAARVGLLLGVCFLIAFTTGLISHYAQSGDQALGFPTRPVWGYRASQALHVVAGTAAIPLLLIKLWVVYPRLFQSMPRRPGPLLRAGLERGSIAALVAASILELAIGTMNVAQWYAWRFDFKQTHYGLAWVVIGSLVVHVAVKLPIIRAALGEDVDSGTQDRATATEPGVISRRDLVRVSWLAAAVAVVAGSTAASTAPVLNRLAVLSPRSVRAGIPINRTAQEAGVVAAATSPDFRCTLSFGERTQAVGLTELRQMPQSTHTLPIACVEGWSASGRWTGVSLRSLLDRIGAPTGHEVRISSLQRHGPGRITVLPANFVDDERTLLALQLDGEPLSVDHGFPARLIAPNRPGALQTKWVTGIEVL